MHVEGQPTLLQTRIRGYLPLTLFTHRAYGPLSSCASQNHQSKKPRGIPLSGVTLYRLGVHHFASHCLQASSEWGDASEIQCNRSIKSVCSQTILQIPHYLFSTYQVTSPIHSSPHQWILQTCFKISTFCSNKFIKAKQHSTCILNKGTQKTELTTGLPLTKCVLYALELKRMH